MSKYVETTLRDPNTGIETKANPHAIQMNYIDPTGATAVGYSINNKMYKDAAGTQPIDNGSIVTNAAGTQTWIKTAAGGVEYSEHQKQLAQAAQPSTQLTNAKNAAMTAANQRLEADIQAIEQNRPLVNQQYNDLARQNYRGYMRTGEALANGLASQGLYNSGYSDTAKIAQATSYREQQNANERARLNALAELDNQISLARLNGSANLNELEAQYAQLLNEQANLDREFNYQRERDTIADNRYNEEWLLTKDQWEAQKDQILQQCQTEAEQWAYEKAFMAAETGDFSKLEELKISTAAAEHLYELEQETMYRSVYGDDTAASPDADVPEQYKALQEKDAEAYETVVEYARTFAENQYGRDEQELTEYMHDMVNWVRRQYGEEYAKLYREVINANFAALDQQVYEQNTAAYGTFDLDAFIANAQQIVYGDVVKTKEDGLGNTQKTTSREVVDPVARENYLLELMVAYQTPYSQMTDAEFRRGYQALGYTEKEVRELMKAQEEQGE